MQLWAALPNQHRDRAASFQHVPKAPVLELRGGMAYVFVGRCGETVSPAEHFSDLIGADVRVHPGVGLTLPLERHYEHAVPLLEGDGTLDGQRLTSGVLSYLGTQRTDMTLASVGGGHALLIGGPPFPETILMWGNFVARTPDEIRQARDDWEAHRRFGEVPACNGPRLAAPDLGRLATPNPVGERCVRSASCDTRIGVLRPGARPLASRKRCSPGSFGSWSMTASSGASSTPEVPPKVEYHLPHWGQSLCPTLDLLLTWSEQQPSGSDAERGRQERA